MVVLGIWAGIIGYSVIYLGLCNYQSPGSLTLAQVFTGGGSCACKTGAGGPGPPAAAAGADPAPPASTGFPLWGVAAS